MIKVWWPRNLPEVDGPEGRQGSQSRKEGGARTMSQEWGARGHPGRAGLRPVRQNLRGTDWELGKGPS